MKTLLLVLTTIVLVGCGSTEGSGVNGATPAAPVDSSPHDYGVGQTVLSDYGQPHNLSLHQICNFGLVGLRDESVIMTASAAGEKGGIGCGGVRNFTIEMTNMGAVAINIWFEIDGVYHPELDKVLAPAETYTFRRGF